MSKFSLGGFIAAMEEGYEPQASRNFTAQDFRTIAQTACEAFRNGSLNLFSCFELEGEFALWSTLQNYIQTKNLASAEITAAAESGDAGALARAFHLAMKLAFVQLYEKNALRRLQLVNDLPAEAQRELERMIPSKQVRGPVAPIAPPETDDPYARLSDKPLSRDEFTEIYNKMSSHEMALRLKRDPSFRAAVDKYAPSATTLVRGSVGQ